MDAPQESPVVRCDLSHASPNAETVDTLARLLVGARRCGYSLRLCNASPQLLELIDFMGLRDTFAASVEATSIEMRR